MEYIDGMKGPDFFDDKRIPEINYEKSIRKTLRPIKQLRHHHVLHEEERKYFNQCCQDKLRITEEVG